jgi:hypothetical protein
MNESSEETAKASICKCGLLAPKMNLEKRCNYGWSSCMKCLRHGLSGDSSSSESTRTKYAPGHTLHAKMYAQAHASSTPPRSKAMTSTATSLLDALKRRNRDPQTSAMARCTSELHSGSTTDTHLQVRCTMSDSVSGTRKCLKRELNVARSVVRAAEETGRGRNRRSRSSKSSYEGRIIDRRSWTNFCMRLRGPEVRCEERDTIVQ